MHIVHAVPTLRNHVVIFLHGQRLVAEPGPNPCLRSIIIAFKQIACYVTYVKSLQTSNTDIITLLQSFISNPNQIFNQFEAFVSKKFGEAELRSIWTYTEEVQITVI